MRIPYPISITLLAAATIVSAAPLRTIDELVAAVRDAKEGSNLELAEGSFRLTQPLGLAAGLALTGVGIGKTIITRADSWQANPATLPDPETNHGKFDRTGYLIRCRNDANNITISHLTLKGPGMHGAIFGMANEGLHFHHLRVEDTMFGGFPVGSAAGAEE